MSSVTYSHADGIAVITLDDGKANVMSMSLIAEFQRALDQAEADDAVVVIQGRETMLSAGFDRAMLSRSRDEIIETVRAGGELVHRLIGLPTPLVIACSGHAIAQGALVLLTADTAIGARGDYLVGLNEVAIGLTIPWYGIETARNRLSPSWFNHATNTGRLFTPDEAERAGFLDWLVPSAELSLAVEQEAQRLRDLDRRAHRSTKERTRQAAIAAVRAGIDTEWAGAITG